MDEFGRYQKSLQMINTALFSHEVSLLRPEIGCELWYSYDTRHFKLDHQQMTLFKGDDACKYHISSRHPKAIFEALMPGVPKVLLLHPKPSFGLSLDIN